jgi:outer membrane protein assembly factor BamB
MPRPLLATLLLLLAWGAPSSALGDAGQGPTRAAAPLDNASHVFDDDPNVVARLNRAREAEAQGSFGEAAEQLQAVLDLRFVDASGREAAPYVVAVDGRATYEGAWLVARHRLAAGPEGLRSAYAQRYAGPARAALARAAQALDEGALAEIARRHLVLDEGRAAALVLADLAIERGEVEAAFARLEALEDLEEVSGEEPEVIARWRAARLAREARLVARSPADVDAVRGLLEAAAVAGPAAAVMHDRVPPALRRTAPTLTSWPTTGGTPDRAGRVADLPGVLVPGASVALGEDGPERAEDRDGWGARADRPSPWVPPRAVVGRDAVFVFDGEMLTAFTRADGRQLHRVRLRGEGEGRPALGQDPREELPLLEGHTLTLDETPGRATRLYVASATRTLRAVVREQMGGGALDGRGGNDEPPWGEIVMLRWDGERLLKGWRASGFGLSPRLPERLAAFGAPCLHLGVLWVAGVRPSEATPDQVECWLVGLDPATGDLRRSVQIGSGSPWRLKRLDEAVPSTPAASHGRVVVSSALGFVAAVDAEDGRVAWIQRYDRSREVGRLTRLASQEADLSPRLTGFANEPPVIAFGVTVVAPTDSNQLLGLATRPRGAERRLVLWDPRDRRTDFERMAVESIVGVAGGDGQLPASILVAGRGDAAEGEPPGKILAALEPVRGQTRWSVEAATGRQPATFGRAALSARRAYVPTLDGLVVVDLARGRVETLLDRSHLPEGHAWPVSRWFGNLTPIPGEGLVAASDGHLTFWKRR